MEDTDTYFSKTGKESKAFHWQLCRSRHLLH